MSTNLFSTDRFRDRHIGTREAEKEQMLKTIGAGSLDQLIDETIPASIRLDKPLNIPGAIGEYNFTKELKKTGAKNKLFRNYIGLGYYGTVIPAVVQRNVLENPGWYTQYTPYQAEISQGRLEALLNFQTMVADLTGMELANASLLDEGTAAAEAMAMFFSEKNKRAKDEPVNRFFVSDKCFPQTIEIIKTRAVPLGIEVIVGDHHTFEFDEKVFGAVVQYPDADGAIHNYEAFVEKAHANGSYVVFASDLLSLLLLKAPGEIGADAVVGNAQRFGVPLGFGGPHAAFFATKDEFKRQIPGRIIGVSIDSSGNPAFRMALQTREQHIKREKATSNICTAQALLAIMSGMYAVYHGPEGLKKIAQRVHLLAKTLEKGLTGLGYRQENEFFFDTIRIDLNDIKADKVREIAASFNINLRYIDEHSVSISVDETTQPQDIEELFKVFDLARGENLDIPSVNSIEAQIELPQALLRNTDFLTHPVFKNYHSETDMMRYIKRLENKDLSLTTSMIPLGSCTMKLNAATQLKHLTWPEFSDIHPFAPENQTAGYRQIISELEDYLSKITGFSATSLQPNSGAQGEYAGLMVIRAYHLDRGDSQRDVVLIPSSAHGTNPASAVMAGMQVVVTKCDERGNIDVEDLRARAEQYKDRLSALMVTYPSTHGVFESGIRNICEIIHENGGLVYMDGANMNAQVGLTNPANIGADVCHLNLHKTFAIPHGGGGPGMGPICVNDKLKPYLPGHSLVKTGGEKAITAISAAPWGSASILIISYAYIRLLGAEGVTDASKYAILNANYLKARLSEHYDILYVGENGRVAHEFIVDFRKYKHTFGIEVEDIAKRLMDYGYHAPTVAFPVPGTLMVEPTESESKIELDKFCDAMIGIRKEIQEIEDSIADKEDNVLKNAPHTAMALIRDEWKHAYSRQKAAYPAEYLTAYKFWPSVGRINNTYGDRNLICSCPPAEEYMQEELV